jgi:hypothetical protein
MPVTVVSESNGNTLPALYIHPALRHRWLYFTIAVPFLVWAGWWAIERVMWLTPDGQAMANVVRSAIAVNQTLLTPPQAYRNVPISAAEMTRLARHAQSELADYFVGARLQFWRDTAKRALNPRDLHWGKTSAWMSWGRIDWIHLGALSYLPGSSTATARASAEFRSNGGDISRADYTYGLVRTAAGWRIDREQSDYEPGYGP